MSLAVGMFALYRNIPVQAAIPQMLEQVADMRDALNFNKDLGFFRGDLTDAAKVSFNDSEFVKVTIPHVLRLEKKYNNTTNGVYKGIGWYRRYFTLDQSYQNKELQLKLEGVITDSDAYLNGEKLYTRNRGYIGFTIDIIDKVKFGKENVLAVRVSNADNPDIPPGNPDSNLDFHWKGCNRTSSYHPTKGRYTPAGSARPGNGTCG